MVRIAILVLGVVLGCGGGKTEDPPSKPADDERSGGGLGDRFGGLADKAKQIGGDAVDKAKRVGGDAVDKAKQIGGDVVDKAKQAAEKAGELSSDALASGKRLKDDVRGKLKFATMDYDLAIDSTPESESDHRARIAGMKQLKVGDYTVGIAQDAKHPLGSVYKWQFRITWRAPTGHSVRLSLFTNEEIPDLELATALWTIIQASERLGLH